MSAIDDAAAKLRTGMLDDDLDPPGSKIIECCLNSGTLTEYEALIDIGTLAE